MSSAVIGFGFGVDLSEAVGEVDFVVVVRRRETEAWLVCDLVLVEVLDEGLDRLPLGEDAMGEDWESCLVPPSTFFWTAYRDWETDRKSTRLNSSHSAKSRMPSSA